MKIDAHQHFWVLARGDYGWLTPDLAPLYCDFQPCDLQPLLTACDIDGTVLVQAAPTDAETTYMLSLAAQNDFILGVVGWVDFDTTDAAAQIATLAKHPKLVGLRPMIQDIADDDWMLRPDFMPAFDAMIANDLTFDALVLPRHLKNLGTLLGRHPNLRTVIDHGAKPEIRDGKFDDWAADMTMLARDTHAYCKLSGIVTEAHAEWAPADIAPYVNHLLSSFGADRIIWGSDWPVSKLAATYEQWHDVALAFAGTDHAAIFGGNAQKAYRLP
ncbi:amidohydrolase [Loktanella sp. D2R18]|uniref:amidohydrolase family protein n=1 Tax=Rhodobacterales TaxID=204455 RepID=UPI000DEBD589|nr:MULTISPECIES: amidohydrolase family protein [Rhodobacterales]MDO6590037.1 amidohydrolase family protein [Yoonia sp. 1_MG-2023]RBW45829.1 amidohydrolase [Loktanella sp. D2R18]